MSSDRQRSYPKHIQSRLPRTVRKVYVSHSLVKQALGGAMIRWSLSAAGGLMVKMWQ
jgi:hypothetical protein